MCELFVVGSRMVSPESYDFLATREPVLFDVWNNGMMSPRDLSDVVPHCHVAQGGNDKTGTTPNGAGVQSYATAIAATCDRNAPCIKATRFSFGKKVIKIRWKKAPCYGCGGNFTRYPNGVFIPWENFRFECIHTVDEIVTAMAAQIRPETKLFRWMEVGDFTPKTVRVAVALALLFPDIRFYGYTKKYRLWNLYVEKHGGSLTAALPKNLVIRFSEWEGFPMDNRYSFPVSAFLPFGSDEPELVGDSVICPCSEPEWVGCCGKCQACAHVRCTVYLKEHSTAATKGGDAKVHAIRAMLKARLSLGIWKSEKMVRKAQEKLDVAIARVKKIGLSPDDYSPRFDTFQWDD